MPQDWFAQFESPSTSPPSRPPADDWFAQFATDPVYAPTDLESFAPLASHAPAPLRPLASHDRAVPVSEFRVAQSRPTLSPAATSILPSRVTFTADDAVTYKPPLAPTTVLDKVENAVRAPVAGVARFSAGSWNAMGAAADALGLESVSAYAREMGTTAADAASMIKGPQAGAGPLERSIYSGLESVGLAAPSMLAGAVTGPIGPAVALTTMGVTTAGEAYRQARDAGKDIAGSLQFGGIQGLVEVVTEMIPASRFLGDLAKGTGLLDMLTRQLVSEVPGEQVATVLQDLNEWATLRPESPFSEYLAERPSAAAHTLVSTLVATVAQTAGGKAVDVAAQNLSRPVARTEDVRLESPAAVDTTGAAAPAGMPVAPPSAAVAGEVPVQPVQPVQPLSSDLPVTPTPSLEAKRSLGLRVGTGTNVRAVDSFEEAGRLVDELRDRFTEENGPGGGASNFPNTDVVDTATGETVATISYNGRIWDATTKKEIERADGRGYGKTPAITQTADLPVTPTAKPVAELSPREAPLTIVASEPVEPTTAPVAPEPPRLRTPFERAAGDTRSRSVDASPPVRRGALTREHAFLMRWLADDMGEMPFQQGGSTPFSRREAYEQATAQDDEGKHGIVFNPRVAGTPTLAMFRALGVAGSRGDIAHAIDRYLTGQSPAPTKAAAAARKLAPVFDAAWDGERFDFARVPEELLATAGIDRRVLSSPITLPSEQQPPDLVERYLKPSPEQRIAARDDRRARNQAWRDQALNRIAAQDERDGDGGDTTFDPDALDTIGLEDDATVQARTLAQVASDPERYVDRYLEAWGPVFNADNASELFPEYSQSVETRATKVKAVRPAASKVIELAFARVLAQPVPEGKLALAVFTSGGNASGKSSAVRPEDSQAVVFDSTLSQLEPSVQRIEQALAAGLNVRIEHVSRHPVDAWRAVLTRALREGGGRTVTIAGHAGTHQGSRETLLALADKYGADPNVTFNVWENDAEGLVVPRPLDWLREQAYPTGDGLRRTLQTVLDDAHASGAITDAIYRGAQGETPHPRGTRADRSGTSRNLPQADQRRAAETQVDVLSTGEAQSRLPGDTGAVRDAEVATPDVADLPFSLTPGIGQRGSVQTGLFGAAPTLDHGRETTDEELAPIRAASAAFAEAQKAYHEKRIGDEEFLAARKTFDQAQAVDDARRGEMPPAPSSGLSAIRPYIERPYLRADMKPSEMMWAYVKETWGSTFAQGDLVDAVVKSAGRKGYTPGGRPQRKGTPPASLAEQKRGVLAWMDWNDSGMKAHAQEQKKAPNPPTRKSEPQWKYEEYSEWSRTLAKNYTRKELEKEWRTADRARGDLADSHRRAIDATTSMTSQSGRRAQSKNAMVGNYERAQAYKDALEIYVFYPEKTKEATLPKRTAPGGTASDAPAETDIPVTTGTVPKVVPRTLFPPEEAQPLAKTGETAVDVTRPVELPELVALGRELAQTPQVVKRFRKDSKLGDFRVGKIRILASLFKPGQEQQLAKTLAHEIGHLADWLPDYTLKRGNILGRLRTLKGFLKHTFTAADGSTIHRDDVRNELLALTKLWHGDWSDGTASYQKYRTSSVELYAEAISVLLNNPGLLQANAPIFYEQFFAELDKKPDVKAAYFGLQELLSGTREELIARRRGGVREMFGMGDTKAIDLEALRQAEYKAARGNLGTRLRIELVDKNVPVIDRVKALEAKGITINQDDDPRYTLKELRYLGSLQQAFLERTFQPIKTALDEAQVLWTDFGEALFYERIIAGDRSELANPRGITTAVAAENYADLQAGLTPEQMKVLGQSVTRFRAAVREIAEKAYEAGLYKPELYEQMQDNPAWAAFRVIDHMEKNVTSKVHHQIGTLKDIQNPADATILKTLVTLRAIEFQEAKLDVFGALQQNDPREIEQAKQRWNGKGLVPVEPEDKKKVLVTYYEAGRVRGKYVPQDVADALENATIGQNLATLEAIRLANGVWFRPVFTTLNLGFQVANFSRDFWRYWSNMKDSSLASTLVAYGKAVPLARVRAFGLPPTASAKQQQAWADWREAKEARILGVTFNDLLSGRPIEDTQIEELFAQHGLGGHGAPPSGARGQAKRLLDFIKNVGDFIETLPKAAAIYELRGAGRISDLTPEQRAFIREKVGSPDFLMGGTLKPITNELFIFSNAITQAIRADVDVATDPDTRGSFWRKNATAFMLPVALTFVVEQFGHLLGGDDDDEDAGWRYVQRILQGVSEYDKTNYTIVPLALDSKGNSVYLRLPRSDSGRLLAALLRKGLLAAKGDVEVMASLATIFDYMAGQVPGTTPALTLAGDVADYASGQQIYDEFRNREVFTRDEMDAGGLPKAKKFLGYEFQQMGGGIVYKFAAGEDRPRELTTAQKVLELPVLSNVVGRFLRISNYGHLERARKVQGEVRSDEARLRMAEKDAVADAIRLFQKEPPPNRTRARQVALAKDVVKQLYADASAAERATQARDVLKQIRMGTARGTTDPLVSAVLGATSIRQKTAVLLDASKTMSAAEFTAWLERARKEDVISVNVAKAVRDARTKGAR